MDKKRVIVTGGFGFIGSHVIEELLKRDDIEIIANIDNLSIGSNAENVPYDERLVHYVTDIAESDTIHSIIKSFEPTHILHLAAQSHVDRSITTPMTFVETNVVGTTVLLEGLRQFAPGAKFVHVSTDEVYGHLLGIEDFPFTEDTPLDPRSPYSSSKASSDLIALSYRNTYNLDITVTRCCNNYGERQFDEKFIPTILRSIVTGKKIPVYGQGNNIREWIYVKDHAKAIIEVAFNGYQEWVYNIPGVERLTNLELIYVIVGIIEDKFAKYKQDNYIEFVADRPGHDMCYMLETNYLDIQSINTQEDFYAAMVKVVEFYVAKFTGAGLITNFVKIGCNENGKGNIS
jgi:dTDP-glucose 4,6-dehydratase